MTKPKSGQEPSGARPLRIRLPGFVAEQNSGLGEVIQRAGYALGIKPCGGCDQRAAALNRWLVFTGKTNRS